MTPTTADRAAIRSFQACMRYWERAHPVRHRPGCVSHAPIRASLEADASEGEVVGRDAVAHRGHLADLAGGEPPRARALGWDVRLHPELLMEAQVLLVGPVDQRGNDEEDGRDADAGEPSSRLEVALVAVVEGE